MRINPWNGICIIFITSKYFLIAKNNFFQVRPILETIILINDEFLPVGPNKCDVSIIGPRLNSRSEESFHLILLIAHNSTVTLH